MIADSLTVRVQENQRKEKKSYKLHISMVGTNRENCKILVQTTCFVKWPLLKKKKKSTRKKYLAIFPHENSLLLMER